VTTTAPGSKARKENTEDELARVRDEAERYRRAAEDALQQLDWCIGYLHGCNKKGIAAALSKNRSFIRQHLLNRDEVSDPTLQERKS
jgi:phage shock protein A